MTLNPGERLNLKILVLLQDKAPEAPPVVLSAEGLPPYASLKGDILTIAPGAMDLGESHVRLVATAGELVASDEFILRVVRPNKVPRHIGVNLEDSATWGSLEWGPLA